MKRLQEQDKPKKEKKEPVATQPPVTKLANRTQTQPIATRQMSEGSQNRSKRLSHLYRLYCLSCDLNHSIADEIDRIKRQNKGSASATAVQSSATTAAVVANEPERPTPDRVAALKSRTTSNVPTSEESDNSSATSPVRRTPPQSEVSPDTTTTNKVLRTQK